MCRLPVAGIRRARGQRFTVGQDVSDQEGGGDGARLGCSGHRAVVRVGRQRERAASPLLVRLALLVFLVLLAPRRRRARAHTVRVRRGAKLRRRPAFSFQAAVTLGDDHHRTSGSVGQQRVDAKAGAGARAVGGRLHRGKKSVSSRARAFKLSFGFGQVRLTKMRQSQPIQ